MLRASSLALKLRLSRLAVKPNQRRGRGTPLTRGECARRFRTDSCGDQAERERSAVSIF